MGLFTRLFGKNKASDEKARKQEIAEQGLKSDEEFSTLQKAEKEKEELSKAAKEEELAEEAKSEDAMTQTKPEEAKSAPKGAAVKSGKKPTDSKTPTKAKKPEESKTQTKVAKLDASAKDKKSDAEETVAESKSARSGKFEIKKSKDGRFVFNLYASNYVIIATSQVYSSSSAAMNGIKSVIANAPTAPIEDQTLKNYETCTYPKWELYQDKGGQYRFRLCASNGSCVCHSQGYTAKSNCKNGIDSIIKFAKDAQIDKSYLKKE